MRTEFRKYVPERFGVVFFAVATAGHGVCAIRRAEKALSVCRGDMYPHAYFPHTWRMHPRASVYFRDLWIV